MTEKHVFTRREFLRTAALVSAGVTLPAFLARSVALAGGESELRNGLALPGFKDDRVLVVLQLGGGNDSLNTIIPYADDAYYRARRRIGVPKKRIITEGDHLGFHEKLKALKGLYDDGKVAPDTAAEAVQLTQVDLRHSVAVLGGAAVPFGGVGVALRQAETAPI